MAKRIISIFLAAVTLAMLSVTGFAVNDDIRRPRVVLEDYQNALYSDEEEALLEEMQSAADKINTDIGIIIADDLGTVSEEEYCETFVEAYFHNTSSSITLLLVADGSGDIDWVYTTGKASSVYDKQLDNIFDAVYYGRNSGVSPNYKAASEQFCRYLVNNSDGYSGADPSEYGDIHYMAVLTDYQYALSSSEEEDLLEVIQSTADAIGANVGVVLSDSLFGKSERQYTDDFLDDNFGADSSSIVLMLVKEGTGNQDWIACTKDAYDIYGSQIDDIFDDVYYGMDSGASPNYPAAIREFCSYLRNHQTGYVGSSGSNYSSGISCHFGMGQIIAIIIAFFVSLTVVGTHAAGYKKRAPISARAYLDNNRTRFTEKNDVYIREYTTSHKISSSSGGGHHGGGGGRSHSGSRGGGGGRHR